MALVVIIFRVKAGREDVTPTGSMRFLARTLRLADDVTSGPDAVWASGDADLRRATHRLLAEHGSTT